MGARDTRVHVEAHGLGTYVRFDNFLSRVAHTIDLGGGETLTSAYPCRGSWLLRQLCCCSAARPVADGWKVVDARDLGSVHVSTHGAGGAADDCAGAGEHCHLRAAVRGRARGLASRSRSSTSGSSFKARGVSRATPAQWALAADTEIV
jgi:hypothetical protein